MTVEEGAFQMLGDTTVFQQNDEHKWPARMKGDFYGQSVRIDGPLVAGSAKFLSTTVHGGNLWLYGGTTRRLFPPHYLFLCLLPLPLSTSLPFRRTLTHF